jgi:predicted glycosyltransferase
MNREAAALNIPVYSIFRGKIGAVDRRLEQEGRLIIIRTMQEVWTKINFVHRHKLSNPDNSPRPALLDIIHHIEDIARVESPGLKKS